MNIHIGISHKPFYDHLVAGGKIWRRDPLNSVNEVLSRKTFMDDCYEITKFGYKDLMIIHKESEKYFYDYIED